MLVLASQFFLLMFGASRCTSATSRDFVAFAESVRGVKVVSGC